MMTEILPQDAKPGFPCTMTSLTTNNVDLWPSLAESHGSNKNNLSSTTDPSPSKSRTGTAANNGHCNNNSNEADDWEFVASDCEDHSNSTSEQAPSTRRTLLRCSSTPEFANIDTTVVLNNDDAASPDASMSNSKQTEEDESFIDCSSSIDDQSHVTDVSNAVLVSYPRHNNNSTNSDEEIKTSSTTTSVAPVAKVRRVPSFKDAILLNAEEQCKEQAKSEQLRKEAEEKLRKDALRRRKACKPKLVVSPIRRCSKSTGDLTSLLTSIHEEDEGNRSGWGGGDGGGGVSSAPIHEEEVMGETDAMEYYNRKSKGSTSRANGMKTRPDEAKRKEIIMHKKQLQRQKQRQKESGKG